MRGSLLVPAKMATLLLEFPTSSNFEPELNCIENLTIVVTHLVYRLVLQFLTACFAKFPRISLPHFRFKLLQTSRQRKPEVALKFRV